MVSPDLDITQDGNKFIVKVRILYLSKESSFTVDEQFEEAHWISGALMKVLFVSLNYTVELLRHIKLRQYKNKKLIYCRDSG